MIRAKLIGWCIAGVVGAFTVGTGLGWWYGNDHGRMACQDEIQKAVMVEQSRQRGLADELDNAKRERDRLARQGVRTIYLEPDPTGCADTVAIDGVLGALRSGPPGSATGGGHPTP